MHDERNSSLITNPSSAEWRRSRHCDANACVEVAQLGEDIGLRDSKDPNGLVLRFSRDEWDAFVAGVSDGDFRFN